MSFAWGSSLADHSFLLLGVVVTSSFGHLTRAVVSPQKYT